MVGPTIYGQILIFLVFVPCLSFQGVEGKMFSPMVITLMLALGAAFVLSLTFVPAVAAILDPFERVLPFRQREYLSVESSRNARFRLFALPNKSLVVLVHWSNPATKKCVIVSSAC